MRGFSCVFHALFYGVYEKESLTLYFVKYSSSNERRSIVDKEKYDNIRE